MASSSPSPAGSKPHDYVVKLLLIGDSGAGKTSILLRYSDDIFTPSFLTTIGIDFKIRTADILGHRVKLQIWDTAGQERFRTITTAYYRGAHGIVLVYDVSDARTFKSVRSWLKQVDTHAAVGVCKILVGNKSDVDPSLRAVSTAEGQKLAEEFGIPFLETSAKDNINVEKCFNTIAGAVVQKQQTAGAGGAAGGPTGSVKLDGGNANRGSMTGPAWASSCCK